MGIKILEQNEKSITFKLDNGDFEALSKITRDWEFKDEISALRFALAVLYITNKGNLYQKKDDNTFNILEPMKDLTKLTMK
jgi:hypothetical protein